MTFLTTILSKNKVYDISVISTVRRILERKELVEFDLNKIGVDETIKPSYLSRDQIDLLEVFRRSPDQ